MDRTTVVAPWSPAQGMAIWLGAWLSGHAGFDHLLDSLLDLGGPHAALVSDETWAALAAETRGAAGDVLAGAQAVPGGWLTDQHGFLTLLRAVSADPQQRPGPESEPVLRLILSGPGDTPALPAGTEAARLAAEAGAAVTIVDAADPATYHVLVPDQDEEGTWWRWHRVVGPLPATAQLSPGEADLALSDAVRQAAAQVGAARLGPLPGVRSPRLAVGALSDALSLPGLPDAVPVRSARLFARADQVTAILSTVGSATAGAHLLDAELLPLWRSVRQARVAGVEYALREWMRP